MDEADWTGSRNSTCSIEDLNLTIAETWFGQGQKCIFDAAGNVSTGILQAMGFQQIH